MSEPFIPKLVKMCAQAGLKTEYDVKRVSVSNADANTSASKSKFRRMRAAFLKSKVWPSHTKIKIGFMSEPSEYLPRTTIAKLEKEVDTDGNTLQMDPLQRLVNDLPIKDAIIKIVTERLQPIVNVKLIFYDEDNQLINPNVADIRIDFNDMGGAWSLLGTECLTVQDKNEPTMNFGWFDVATVLHEFCHALGMIHEHQNPKGKKILWDKPRVREWAKSTQGWNAETTETNIIERYNLDEINGSTFDSKSIMLYFFPGNVVLDPNTQQCCGSGTNQNLMFSPYDVLYLNYNYPLKNSPLTSEQFTVKYFNDVFNQQVDIDDLKKQLDSSRSSEKSESSDGPIRANALAPKAVNAQKPRAQNAQKPVDGNESTPTKTESEVKPEVKTPSGETLELCKPGCVVYNSDQMIMLSIMLFIIILLCVIIAIAIFRK